MLNWLYLALWVKNEPVTLHFKIGSAKAVAGDKLYPLPIEEKNYQIEKVMIDNKSFEIQGDSELFITLPELKDAHVEVTIKARN